MILEQLTVRDFCLYRGRQVFDLTPGRRGGKALPIVLFGGINGGGKTTLFDAIQLALYGPRARCSKRANLAYEDFLRQSVHHGVAETEGAGVTLAFRYATDGQDHRYEVRRAWQVEEGRFRESLSVYQDGLYSTALTSNWPQVVEELIPLEISQLFFFDGEKIRALAEDSSSSAALGAAVKALLGLDLVERLIADATVLQTRLAKQAGTPEQRAGAEELERQYQAARAELERLKTEQAALENRRLRAAEELHAAEGAFAAGGGKHWEARQAHRQRLADLTALVREVEGRLLDLAAGELPLAMVPDLLERAEQQDRRERTAAEAEIVHRLLLERDNRLLEVLRAAGVPPGLLRVVYDHLDGDRQARQPAERGKPRLALSEGTGALLLRLRQQRLDELVAEAGRLLEKRAQAVQEREDVERALAATPADADIGRIAERFKTAAGEVARFNEQARRLKEAEDARKAELTECEAKLRRLWQGQVEEEHAREDYLRLVRLAGRTRDTMQEFLRRATERKIDRLAAFITESFRFLLRKQTLVERVVIDPATFAITLYDAAGQPLPKRRLSEGEKQIFAVAVLWGLARAAARPLPAVIDTPMARLDDAHRRHLVERYFPNASHQVLLFSTDTEVDRPFYQALRPALARAYHLRYDEATRVTAGEAGYFWKEEAGS
jgi:DNA sulfur modification protein DndD